MLFNSYAFIFLFLPATVAGYYLIGRRQEKGAASWLALVSLFFYGYWSLPSLPLLVGSVVANFWFGRVLASPSQRWRKGLLIAFVAANLLLLGYFKYAGFFIDNLNAVLVHAGRPSVRALHVLLPIGISFFTFTQIAFLVDSYQGKVRGQSFINYTLFVTFFPHLIAGPVIHHKQMMPQFADPGTYRMDPRKVSLGIALFTLGLAKKLLIADVLAGYADLLFESAARGIVPLGFLSWSGSLAYTFQIYFDFSGYSDMAIGLSLLFGVLLPLNFNAPLRATSMIDFWQRWHMSLTKYVGEYLYTPLTLALTRQSYAQPAAIEIAYTLVIPTVLTFLIIGLWHGPAWHYIVFGGIHGTCLVLNHLWRRYGASMNRAIAGVSWSVSSWALTFLAINAGFVMFRADGVVTAGSIYRGLLGLNGHAVSSPAMSTGGLQAMLWQNLPFARDQSMSQFMFTMLAAILVTLLLPSTATLTPSSKRDTNNGVLLTRPWAPVLLALVFVVSVLSLGRTSPFLYFQF